LEAGNTVFSDGTHLDDGFKQSLILMILVLKVGCGGGTMFSTGTPEKFAKAK